MEPEKFAKQMVELNKTILDNSFRGMTMVQDYSENLADGFLRQFPWGSGENRKTFDASLFFMKRIRDTYKRAVDEGFSRLEEIVDNNGKDQSRNEGEE